MYKTILSKTPFTHNTCISLRTEYIIRLASPYLILFFFFLFKLYISMQETSPFLHSIMHIQISMDGLGIKSLGSIVWHTTIYSGCYTAIYIVNFVGYQAKLFKRNKKVLLEGKRNMIHSTLSTTILHDFHAKHFKSQVIHRSCSPKWYQSFHQFQSWQNKSLKTSVLLDMDVINNTPIWQPPAFGKRREKEERTNKATRYWRTWVGRALYQRPAKDYNHKSRASSQPTA